MSKAEVMGLNPVEASDFFLGFLCNCLSYFTTAKITFTSNVQSIIVEYQTGFLTGLGKLWQLYNTTTFVQIIIHSVARNLIDRLFFQPIKILHHTHHAPRINCPTSCEHSFCSDMFTKFTIKTVRY